MWPRHPGLENYQISGNNLNNHQTLQYGKDGISYGPPYVTAQAAQPPSYSTPPSYSYQYASKPEPVIECDYVPRENCTKVEGGRNCKQIPRQVPEEVCITDIPIQTVREECTDVTKQGIR